MPTTASLKWTDRLTDVVRRARHLEETHGKSCISIESIFATILDSSGVAAQALKSIDFTPAAVADLVWRPTASSFADRITQLISGIFRSKSATGRAVQTMPFSESAAAAFAAAEQEAYSLRCNYLGTEHILLAMLSTTNELSTWFERHEVRYESVRNAVKRALHFRDE